MQNYFWQFDKSFDNNIILVDADNDIQLTYRESDLVCGSIAGCLPKEKSVVFLFCKNDYKSILYYLALLRSGNAVLLLDSKLNDEIIENLLRIYQPDLILGLERYFAGYEKKEINSDYSFHEKLEKDHSYIFPDTGVLLSTSGTTGSPKLVRLSYKNIQANAESITNYLGIKVNDKAITSLPMSYSYGLSVINSHILAGSTLVMTDKSFVFKDFWKIFSEYQCNSFAGVPYSYELLKKINFEKMELPSLKVMTQAGGRLSTDLAIYFSELSKSRGFRFFVMYGQTEATARISYVPAESLPMKAGSIGIPIPGGKMEIFSGGKTIKEPGIIGELVYKGENVMLGYASRREDLSCGDQLNGILHTGDLAYRDEDDFYYITGRLKRFIKVFGLRLNLDDVENMIEHNFSIFNACSGTDDKLHILIDIHEEHSAEEIKQKISEYYKINKSVITVRHTEKIPVTESGKKDYNAISKLF